MLERNELTRKSERGDVCMSCMLFVYAPAFEIVRDRREIAGLL